MKSFGLASEEAPYRRVVTSKRSSMDDLGPSPCGRFLWVRKCSEGIHLIIFEKEMHYI